MERQLTALLRQATTAIRAAFRHALVDLGLTPQQNTVLHLLAAAPGSSSADLARRTHVSPQTMHKLVTDLERRGLLSLHPRAGHGRILDIHLTREGERLLREADERAQALEERVAAGLSAEQQRELIALLQHCVTALELAPDERRHATPAPRAPQATDR